MTLLKKAKGFGMMGYMDAPQKTIDTRLEAIEKTLQEHNALLRAVYAHSKKTQRFILWGRVMSLFYLILIVAPLIIAAVYLPPLLQQYVGSYQELLDVSGGLKGKGSMMQNLQDQLKLFNNSQ